VERGEQVEKYEITGWKEKPDTCPSKNNSGV